MVVLMVVRSLSLVFWFHEKKSTNLHLRFSAAGHFMALICICSLLDHHQPASHVPELPWESR